MDDLGVLSKIIDHGGVGAVCLILLLICRELWKRVNEVQEKRITEGLAWQALLRDNTEVLKDAADVQRTQTDVIRALSEANRNTSDAVRGMTATLQSLAAEQKFHGDRG